MNDDELARAYNEHMAEVNRPTRPGSIPFDGLDRDPFPPREQLANFERRGWLGVAPRRSAWPELEQIDSRIADLQTRHAETQERVRSLTEQRANAPLADANALAEWEMTGRKGAKPKPVTDTLNVQIADAERDRDGLERAVDLALEEKAAYVARHRERLVTVAGQQAAAAHTRMLELVNELEQARNTLVELRSAEVWAALFPDAAAAGSPQTGLIARGLAEPMKALGLNPPLQIPAERVIELLRRDADVLLTAATPEQRAAIDGGTPDRANGAVWANSPAAVEQHRRERHQALERYRKEWGHDPA